jgi:hypothetical protein
MIRTASDLFVGATFRQDDDDIKIIDFLTIIGDGSIYVEGYEVESGEEFGINLDPDDEINIY